MAKPIELGFVLEGEDAERFQEYMKHPTYPERGRRLLKEAAEIAKKTRL